MVRTRFLTRSALGLALALGSLAGVGMIAAPAHAAKKEKEAPQSGPKLKLSKDYQAASNALIIAWNAAKAKPEVVAAQAEVKAAGATLDAATTVSAQKAAQTAFDQKVAALMGLIQPEVDQFNALVTKIVGNDDRYHAGTIGFDMGNFALSQSLQRQGLQLQVDSGLVAADRLPLYNFFIGRFAYYAKDYAGAQKALGAAVAGGFHDNDADRLLAETYFGQNDARGGLASLKSSIEAARTAGRAVPASWLARGLVVVNDAIVPEHYGFFSTGLVQAKPDARSWNSAIYALRRITKYGNEESIDVVRLMDRTGSYLNGSDYSEYLQLGVLMGLPREVLAVADKAVASGKMTANDQTLSEARRIAQSRLKQDTDQGLVRGYEKDLAGANPSLVTLMGAGDSFLTYGENAKAEAAFTRALAMPGVDKGRALMRIGIAQFDQGKFAEAEATFAKVDGPRQPLAQLWAALAANKAKPAA